MYANTANNKQHMAAKGILKCCAVLCCAAGACAVPTLTQGLICSPKRADGSRAGQPGLIGGQAGAWCWVTPRSTRLARMPGLRGSQAAGNFVDVGKEGLLWGLTVARQGRG